MQRLNIIKTTEGFGENILADNYDFDYEALGLVRSAA